MLREHTLEVTAHSLREAQAAMHRQFGEVARTIQTRPAPHPDEAVVNEPWGWRHL